MLKLRDWIDINKIDWDILSYNTNAIELLKENQDKINWYILSSNKNAIEILKSNKDKLYWFGLSKNSNIFIYDYEKIKYNMKNSGIAEELMAHVFHPNNMEKWNDWGFSEHQEMVEFIND